MDLVVENGERGERFGAPTSTIYSAAFIWANVRDK